MGMHNRNPFKVTSFYEGDTKILIFHDNKDS